MKIQYSSILHLVIVVLVLLGMSVSPAQAQPNLVTPTQPEPPDGLATYQVTIEHFAGGQPLSPVIAATHTKDISMFTPGAPASAPLEAIAENGDNAAMAALLGDAAEVTDVYTNSLPLLPVGNAVTFTIQARSGDRLSLAMMLICTNDGFVGLDSVELPRFGSSVFGAFAYDAGTETNSERSEDLPDNCSTLGPVPLDGDPNGNANEPPLMSHPVTPHPGLQGTGDLSAQHQWLGAAAKVTVVQIAASSPLLLAPLSGLAEVPPVMTPTKGAAGVVLLANEDALAFMVLVINATNVTAAHIHYGLPNENGPIVATLLQTSEPISDTVNGILTSGLITADEVAEVFEGGFDAFVAALFTGQLYVNVHTADHPDGEVRGQLGVVPLQLHPPMSLEALLNQATPDGIDGSTIYLPMLSQ